MAKDIRDISNMDRLYNDLAVFRARALEEIKRAERYPTFISLVSVDLTHIGAQSEIENFKSFDDFISALRKLVRKSIRETDLISGSDRRKILILLVETPPEGAQAFSKRLKKTVRYFLANNVKSPVDWRVPVKEYHFPSSPDDEIGILSALDSISE